MKKILMFFLFVSCVFFVEAMEVDKRFTEKDDIVIGKHTNEALKTKLNIVTRRHTNEELKVAANDVDEKMRKRDFTVALNATEYANNVLKTRVCIWKCESSDYTFVRFCFYKNRRVKMGAESFFGVVMDLSIRFMFSEENEKLKRLKRLNFNGLMSNSNSKKKKSSNVKLVELESLVGNGKGVYSLERLIEETKAIVGDNKLFNAILHTNCLFFQNKVTKSNFIKLLRGDFGYIIKRIEKFFNNNSIRDYLQFKALSAILSVIGVAKLLTQNIKFVDKKIDMEEPRFVDRNYPVYDITYNAIVAELCLRYLIFGSDSDVCKAEKIMKIRDDVLSRSMDKVRRIVDNEEFFRNVVNSAIRFYTHNFSNIKIKKARIKGFQDFFYAQRSFSLYDLIAFIKKLGLFRFKTT